MKSPEAIRPYQLWHGWRLAEWRRLRRCNVAERKAYIVGKRLRARRVRNGRRG